jgi:hypothetical protein
MERSAHTPARTPVAWWAVATLAVCWAVPQIMFCGLDLWYSHYPPAVINEYQNAPLPTMPGPLWLTVVYGLLGLMAEVCLLVLLTVVLLGAIATWRLMTARWRVAWLAVSAAGLGVQAAMWTGPDEPVPTALGIAAAAAAMIWLLWHAGTKGQRIPASSGGPPPWRQSG